MSEIHNENRGSGHISTRNYAIGLALAVVLTLVSFGIVLTHVVPKQVAIIGLLVAAVLQMLVHLHYFLHLDRSPEQRWNLLSVAFTGLLLFIFIGGSIWIMFTLNMRMM